MAIPYKQITRFRDTSRFFEITYIADDDQQRVEYFPPRPPRKEQMAYADQCMDEIEPIKAY